MKPSALESGPFSLVSDVLDALRKHPGLSMFSFVCCIPFVVLAPGLSSKTRRGIGAGWGAMMLLVAAASALRGVLTA
jgi:hypothetical protein